MTNEEATNVLGDVRAYLSSRANLENEILAGHTFIDICNAIKTVEQEPILDKIRAEVERKIVKRPWLDFKDKERDRNDAFLEVLDIIDKYKAEMEE